MTKQNFDLLRESTLLAGKLSSLLSGTICGYIYLQAAIEPRTKCVVVTNRPDPTDVGRMVSIPLCRSGKPKLHMGVQIRLQSDDQEEKHLMAVSSVFVLALDPELSQELLHYDYERKKDGYPEAHLHVCATSGSWEKLLDKPLNRLHFPVGGRRYRPTLEDLVEFLIREKILVGKNGWEKCIADHRDEFQRIQLRAAVRRYPEIAIEELRRIEMLPAAT